MEAVTSIQTNSVLDTDVYVYNLTTWMETKLHPRLNKQTCRHAYIHTDRHWLKKCSKMHMSSITLHGYRFSFIKIMLLVQLFYLVFHFSVFKLAATKMHSIKVV